MIRSAETRGQGDSQWSVSSLFLPSSATLATATTKQSATIMTAGRHRVGFGENSMAAAPRVQDRSTT